MSNTSGTGKGLMDLSSPGFGVSSNSSGASGSPMNQNTAGPSGTANSPGAGGSPMNQNTPGPSGTANSSGSGRDLMGQKTPENITNSSGLGPNFMGQTSPASINNSSGPGPNLHGQKTPPSNSSGPRPNLVGQNTPPNINNSSPSGLGPNLMGQKTPPNINNSSGSGRDLMGQNTPLNINNSSGFLPNLMGQTTPANINSSSVSGPNLMGQKTPASINNSSRLGPNLTGQKTPPNINNSSGLENNLMGQTTPANINNSSVSGPNLMGQKTPASINNSSSPGPNLTGQKTPPNINNSSGLGPNLMGQTTPPNINNSSGLGPNLMGQTTPASINNSSGLGPNLMGQTTPASINNSTGSGPNLMGQTTPASINNSSGLGPNLMGQTSPASINNSTGSGPNLMGQTTPTNINNSPGQGLNLTGQMTPASVNNSAGPGPSLMGETAPANINNSPGSGVDGMGRIFPANGSNCSAEGCKRIEKVTPNNTNNSNFSGSERGLMSQSTPPSFTTSPSPNRSPQVPINVSNGTGNQSRGYANVSQPSCYNYTRTPQFSLNSTSPNISPFPNQFCQSGGFNSYSLGGSNLSGQGPPGTMGSSNISYGGCNFSPGSINRGEANRSYQRQGPFPAYGAASFGNYPPMDPNWQNPWNERWQSVQAQQALESFNREFGMNSLGSFNNSGMNNLTCDPRNTPRTPFRDGSPVSAIQAYEDVLGYFKQMGIVVPPNLSPPVPNMLTITQIMNPQNVTQQPNTPNNSCTIEQTPNSAQITPNRNGSPMSGVQAYADAVTYLKKLGVAVPINISPTFPYNMRTIAEVMNPPDPNAQQPNTTTQGPNDLSNVQQTPNSTMQGLADSPQIDRLGQNKSLPDPKSSPKKLNQSARNAAAKDGIDFLDLLREFASFQKSENPTYPLGKSKSNDKIEGATKKLLPKGGDPKLNLTSGDLPRNNALINFELARIEKELAAARNLSKKTPPVGSSGGKGPKTKSRGGPKTKKPIRKPPPRMSPGGRKSAGQDGGPLANKILEETYKLLTSQTDDLKKSIIEQGVPMVIQDRIPQMLNNTLCLAILQEGTLSTANYVTEIMQSLLPMVSETLVRDFGPGIVDVLPLIQNGTLECKLPCYCGTGPPPETNEMGTSPAKPGELECDRTGLPPRPGGGGNNAGGHIGDQPTSERPERRAVDCLPDDFYDEASPCDIHSSARPRTRSRTRSRPNRSRFPAECIDSCPCKQGRRR